MTNWLERTRMLMRNLASADYADACVENEMPAACLVYFDNARIRNCMQIAASNVA